MEEIWFQPLYGFKLEAEQFVRLVRGEAQAWTGASPAESIDIAATIAAARQSAAENGRWIDLPERA